MTQEGWELVVLRAVDEAVQNDRTKLDHLTHLLAEQDTANEILRHKGYGIAGCSLLAMVTQLPQRKD